MATLLGGMPCQAGHRTFASALMGSPFSSAAGGRALTASAEVVMTTPATILLMVRGAGSSASSMPCAVAVAAVSIGRHIILH